MDMKYIKSVFLLMNARAIRLFSCIKKANLCWNFSMRLKCFSV